MDVPLLPIAPADCQQEQHLPYAQFFLYDIRGPDSGAAEDSSFFALTRIYVPTFRRHDAPPKRRNY